MEKIFLEFLNIYFWVFIIIVFIELIIKSILETKYDWEFQNVPSSLLSKIILITLFILSIILT